MASDPEKVRISDSIPPTTLTTMVDACALPDLVKHTIKSLIQPYVCSPQSPRRDATDEQENEIVKFLETLSDGYLEPLNAAVQPQKEQHKQRGRMNGGAH